MDTFRSGAWVRGGVVKRIEITTIKTIFKTNLHSQRSKMVLFSLFAVSYIKRSGVYHVFFFCFFFYFRWAEYGRRKEGEGGQELRKFIL